MKSKSLFLLAGAALGASAAVASATNDADRAYRAELLADAEQRSSLLAAGATVTHDNGHFTFTDATGNNSMYLGLYGDIRYLFNFGDEERFGDSGDDADGDIVNGFQLARIKLFAGGTVGSEDFQYYFQFGADGLGDGDSSSSAGGLSIEDFWGHYFFEGGASVRVGQGRPQQGFEAMYQPWQQQTFERSLGHALFAVDRTQFVELRYQNEDKTFDIAGNLNDGARQANSNFTSASEADIGIGGRVNWYFSGNADDFGHQSSARGQAYAGRIGGGAHWETHGETGIATPDFDLIIVNADVEVKGDSWGAGGYFYLANIDPESGDDGLNFAFRVRGGFNATEQAEIYAFWDSVFIDEDLIGEDAEDNFHFVGLGVNYHPIADSRAVLIGGEVVISLDDTTDFAGAIDSSLFVGSDSDLDLYNLLGDDDTEIGVGFRLTVLN